MKIIQGLNFVLGKFLNKKNTFLNYSLIYLSRKRSIDRNYMDYIRIATLELVATEITSNQIEGAVAELGVYKGKFARYINKYFPEKSLYLFDTFEGFDKKDINSEVANNYSRGDQDFSQTSANQVLSLMPFPKKCIIKKGFFPATSEGIDEEFSFVSIDTDLYEPIYNGLVYFYPRLKKGGYIFVHDYNNDNYKGAKSAVDKYCAEQGIPRLPIPDSAGTAILMK